MRHEQSFHDRLPYRHHLYNRKSITKLIHRMILFFQSNLLQSWRQESDLSTNNRSDDRSDNRSENMRDLLSNVLAHRLSQRYSQSFFTYLQLWWVERPTTDFEPNVDRQPCNAHVRLFQRGASAYHFLHQWPRVQESVRQARDTSTLRFANDSARVAVNEADWSRNYVNT